MKLTGYKRCPTCETIFKENNHYTTNLDNPSPCCGATNETRELWPSLDKLILIDIVEKQSLEDYKERKVAIVFVCTLLEMLLEETLTTLVSKHVKSVEAVEALMHSAQGRERRIKLFSKLSGLILKDVLENAGYHEFLTEWKDIVSLRNQVVHRGFHGNSEIDIKLTIQNLLKDCISVFVLLNNKVSGLPIK